MTVTGELHAPILVDGCFLEERWRILRSPFRFLSFWIKFWSDGLGNATHRLLLYTGTDIGL